MNPNKKLLILFVKNPLPGHAKTRLAKYMGQGKALEIYQQLLTQTFHMADKVDADKWVFYSLSTEDTKAYQPSPYPRFLQQGEDLGQRMHHAFEQGFEAGYERMVLVGSDIMELQHFTIEDAFDGLMNHHVSMGLAEDGGYYLMGLKEPNARLFENMEWSVPTVAEETAKRVIQEGYTLCQLPMMNDIDTPEDWHAWLEQKGS